MRKITLVSSAKRDDCTPKKEEKAPTNSSMFSLNMPPEDPFNILIQSIKGKFQTTGTGFFTLTL